VDDLIAFVTARLADDERPVVTARMRREIAAKRAILAEHEPRRVGQSLIWCERCHRPIRDAREDEDQCGPFDWPCPTLRALTAVWSGHPDYRPEWKP
jgi:hypothetical protein